MNTHVDFPIAKLLKEKGFDDPTLDCYNLNGLLFSNGWCEYIADDPEFEGLVYASKLKEKDVLAPTIADVVMWLEEKHGIWLVILPELLNGTEIRYYPSVFEQGVGEDIESYFNSPTEAYQEAITYTLKNLIK